MFRLIVSALEVNAVLIRRKPHVDLDLIWSPWRMEYVGGSPRPGCFLCERADLTDRLVVAVREHAFVVLNKYPYARGHVMVCPPRHVARWQELEPRERRAVLDLVRDAGDVLQRACAPDRVVVGMNVGKAAGAGLAGHLHVHLVPMPRGVERPDPVPGTEASLDAVGRTLREAFRSAGGTRTGAPSAPAVGPPPAGLDAPPATLREPAITRAAKLCLTRATPPEWAPIAIARLDETLLDHAWCEKKAAATAMALVSRYPDDAELVAHMIPLASEEWGHFARVHAFLVARQIRFAREQRDDYVNELLAVVRKNEPQRFLDRLLVAAFIEARSCERFALLAEALAGSEPALSAFYRELFVSEARHYTLFVELAYGRFERAEVRHRVAEISAHESDVIERLPLEARMH